MTYAATSTNSNATTAPHSKNAALRSESPYQQRTTQRDNPTQQLIKQAVDYLLQQLEAGKSETLDRVSRRNGPFPQLQLSATFCAIARQRPTATRVAGFRTWKELGRFVKKGEKGIQILAPMVGHRRRKDDADRNRTQDDSGKPAPVLIGFRAVYVFDVAQTEGADLPEFEHNITGEVGEHRDRLIAFLDAAEHRARIQREHRARRLASATAARSPSARPVEGRGVHHVGP